MIPLVDLKKQYLNIKDEIDEAIQTTIDNTRFIGGEEISKFEQGFAKFCDSKYGVGVSSGTSALYVALRVLGIKSGDEVIIPANTFIASAEPISEIGATVKFVDVEQDHLINPDLIKKAITKNTKAIMPVHLYGQMAEMKKITEVAHDHNLSIIEDCAQAHAAQQDNKKAPHSSIGCFSFFPGKNLGAYGDAGMIVTDDEKFAEKASMYINHGRKKTEKYIHSSLGSNYRLDAIQAAILNVKLKYLEQWTEQRRKIANDYTTLLKDIVEVPIVNNNNKHSYHLYVIQTDNRDKLKKDLNNKGIGAGIHYPIPLHKQPPYMPNKEFPVTEKLAKRILSLPIYPELTKEQITLISNTIQHVT